MKSDCSSLNPAHILWEIVFLQWALMHVLTGKKTGLSLIQKCLTRNINNTIIFLNDLVDMDLDQYIWYITVQGNILYYYFIFMVKGMIVVCLIVTLILRCDIVRSK